MQHKTALLRFAFGLAIASASVEAGQAAYLPFQNPPVVETDIVSRDVHAETRLHCLALAIYFEGGSTGESEDGQRHIARVVVERARANRSYWGGPEICDVVFYRKSKCQFSFACLPLAQRTPKGGAAWEYSVSIAREELEGRSSLRERAIYYYMNAELSLLRNVCLFRKEFVAVVQAGRHEFFREATREEMKDLSRTDPTECQQLAAKEKKGKKKLAKKSGKTKLALAKGKKSAKIKYAKR